MRLTVIVIIIITRLPFLIDKWESHVIISTAKFAKLNSVCSVEFQAVHVRMF